MAGSSTLPGGFKNTVVTLLEQVISTQAHIIVNQESIIRGQAALLLSEGNIVADIDILNAAVAAVQGDEVAEEALGAQIFAGIQALQAQAAAGAPDLQPAIAALQALHDKIGTELQAGAGLAATLPTGTPTTPPTPPAS